MQQLLNSRIIWFRVLISCVLVQIFFMILVFFSYSSEEVIFEEYDMTNDFMHVCKLPVYDVTHPSIMNYVNYKYNALAGCNTTFKPYTELVNGEWRIVEQKEGMDCKARCIERVSDYAVKPGDWMLPGKTDCEFLEAVCWKGSKEVYGYIHTQINKKKLVVKRKKRENPPNVFVFLFDSMDFGRAKRSLPKTLAFLSEKFDSVEFPFVNKVGENSLPNGIALWLGKQIETIDQTLFGGTRIEADWNRTEYCYTHIDNNATIFNDFKEQGYVTMDVDDWAAQMINYPNCQGFQEPPTDHYMHAFYTAYEYYGMNITKKHLKGRLCREEHHPAFEYFQQFVDAYIGHPLFSWMWLNSIGHDAFNGIMRADKQLVELIEKNYDLMDNSFFLLMGDHGHRLGYKRLQQTEIGGFERNHPYLSISIPKKFRSDLSIRATMRENAKRLQTHFDTRATLLDIAHFQPKKSFRDRRLLEIPGEKGHSLLRKQPSTPRTCGTLPIPPAYCICQVKKVPETDRNVQRRFGQKVLDHIHKKLDDANFTSSCERFELREVTSLLHFGLSNHSSDTHTFEISIMATSPSYAQFKTLLKHDKQSNEFTFGNIIRLDRYGDTGDCIQNGQLESMCFCNNLTFYQKTKVLIMNVLTEWVYSIESYLPRALLR